MAPSFIRVLQLTLATAAAVELAVTWHSTLGMRGVVPRQHYWSCTYFRYLFHRQLTNAGIKERTFRTIMVLGFSASFVYKPCSCHGGSPFSLPKTSSQQHPAAACKQGSIWRLSQLGLVKIVPARARHYCAVSLLSMQCGESGSPSGKFHIMPLRPPSTMIPEGRIHFLNEHKYQPAQKIQGKYVLYWMQASVRNSMNHALEYAIQRSTIYGLPLRVAFVVTESYPEANARHYQFLLEGLRDVYQLLYAERQIELEVYLIRKGLTPAQAIVLLSKDAAEVVCDVGYTRVQRTWRLHVAYSLSKPVVAVESDVVVPVQMASGKEEFSARFLRPKIMRKLSEYLVSLIPTQFTKTKTSTNSDMAQSTETLAYEVPAGSLAETTKRRSDPTIMQRLDMASLSSPTAIADFVSKLSIDHSVVKSPLFTGGPTEARRLLDVFIHEKVGFYATRRNEPGSGYNSGLSSYLHFGHISPLDIALRLLAEDTISWACKDEFLEELIIRRELSMNFCWYNPDYYDSYSCLPSWARLTLDEHSKDPRPIHYSLQQLEGGLTHDQYWNAAQLEMVHTGKMHNYMRMYWGKKILEWSEDPKEAFQRVLYLNNKYNLDGRDPNSFAGVAWIFGKHDRAHAERAIYGKIRYMAQSGLERKFSKQLPAYTRMFSRKPSSFPNHKKPES